jgi:hypothetical protein
MRRARIIGSGSVLLALCLACGIGTETESTEAESQVVEADERAAQGNSEQSRQLQGGWAQTGGGRECFNADGSYTMVDAAGVSLTGTWQHLGNDTVATTVGPTTTNWRIESLEGGGLVFTGTSASTGGAIRATYTRIGAGGNTEVARVVGCWRRTTGGASECYTADGGYAMRRQEGGPTTPGTWRATGPNAMELTFGDATLPYTLSWQGNDPVTFTQPNGAAETFARLP